MNDMTRDDATTREADRPVPEPDADMTLAYLKGWQDGQDAMRKSVDAATLTSALAALGPGARIAYLAKEDDGQFWCELSLPVSRYESSSAEAPGANAEEALLATVERALTFKREQEQSA